MTKLTEPVDAAVSQQIAAVLEQLSNSRDVDVDPMRGLEVALVIAGTTIGTLQRFDEGSDCLRIVASRGFSSEALDFFAIVRRDTNSTCAVALTRRMRVFVEDVSTSYLFVGTRELDVLRASDIAAIVSTPLISSNSRFLGVVSAHFQKPKVESEFDQAPLDRFAVQFADNLERREGLVPSRHFPGK